jgi:hypothetical protein
MDGIRQYALLIQLILREGHFRHSGHDFQEKRMQVLQDIPQFCPPVPSLGTGWQLKKWLFKNPFLRSWFAQAAFFKSTPNFQGSHLSVPALDLSYIRIPKAASTTLCYAMLQARFPELIHYPMSSEKINFLADVTMEKEAPGDKKPIFFTVVRNPFARIVSVYRNFFEQPSPHFIYQDYLFGILRKGLSFKDFVRILQMIPDSLKDQHVKPQHCFLRFYRDNGLVVKTFTLERPETIRSFLSSYNIPFGYQNRTEKDYDYRIYFDMETLQRVHSLYRQDVELFGYQQLYKELEEVVSG